MKINEVGRGGKATSPRPTLKLAGRTIDGLLEFSVNQNSRYQANDFNLKLSIAAAEGSYSWPEWATISTDPNFDAAAPSTDTGALIGANELLLVEIEMTQYDTTHLLFSGIVDEFDFDPVAGTIYMRGRDKTALFIERKTQEKFLEYTASQLIRELATRVGMQAKNLQIANDDTLIGTVYNEQNVSTTTTRSYWDLMSWAAQNSGYWIYFQGDKLIYTPDPTVADDGEELFKQMAEWLQHDYEIRFDRSNPSRPWSNAVSVSFRRALTVSRDVFVDVRTSDTWSSSHRVTARASLGTRPQTRGGAAQVYSFQLQGKTEAEAREFAERKLRQITSQQVALSATLPGSAQMNEATRITVTGTGSPFDQQYWIDSLTHTYKASSGYVTSLRAKNHDTESTVFG